MDKGKLRENGDKLRELLALANWFDETFLMEDHELDTVQDFINLANHQKSKNDDLENGII